jgi:hypothetical protein
LAEQLFKVLDWPSPDGEGEIGIRETFPNPLTLPYVRYRSALNRCWAVISLLWIAWCLYWPFYARRQDTRAIEAETAETYNICLHTNGMTPAACATDRQAYTELRLRVTWPREQSVYRSFAGKNLSDALSFFTFLCLLPVVFGYVLLRAGIEAIFWFARIRPERMTAHRHPR